MKYCIKCYYAIIKYKDTYGYYCWCSKHKKEVGFYKRCEDYK